jgi:phage-related protein
MTDLIDTVQTTALDDAFIELFDIELKYRDSGGVNRTELIHLVDGLNTEEDYNVWMPYDEGNNSFIWAEYLACPIAIEGISVESAGASSRPTLSIANIASLARNISGYPYLSTRTDSDGTDNEANFDEILKDLQVIKNEDILGSIVTYRKTLLKNTFVKETDTTVDPNVDRWYAQNHPTKSGTSGTHYLVNTAPNPVEFPEQKFVLDRVATETNLLVSFELASPLDVQGLKVPNRYVIGKYCPWAYKGAVAGSVKSGCPWKNNGMRTISVSTNSSGATEGTYAINSDTSGLSYSGDTNEPADWALTVTVDENGSSTVAINRPGHSFESNERITIPTSIIGGAVNLVIQVDTRMNFDINDNYVSDPADDVCGKTVNSCKCRFHPKYDGSTYTNTNIALPFGGFPGSRKFK